MQKILENCVPIYPIQISNDYEYFAGKYIFSGKYTENGKQPLVWQQVENKYILLTLHDACRTGVVCWTFNKYYADKIANNLSPIYI